MAGGIIAVVLCVLALIGVGELMIRAVEGLIGAQTARDPMQEAHGDVPRRAEDELAALRKAGL